jgi:asparagine synthase (glutamine-hydrolysing)
VDPLTAFRGHLSVAPRPISRFSTADGLRCERYWQLAFHEEAPDGRLEAWEEQMSSLLLDASRIRLRADVPVGAYLSGGLDSTYLSTLVQAIVSITGSTPFRCSSATSASTRATFSRPPCRPSSTQHRAIQCSYDDIGRIFPQVVWHAEVPMIRTAPAPLMMLSGLVRQSDFKVVLTGEGADEIFGGYDIFKEAMIRRFWARHPESTLRPLLLKKLYPDIFEQADGRPKAFLIGFFKKNLAQVDSPVYSHMVRWLNTSQLKGFFPPVFCRRGRRPGFLSPGASWCAAGRFRRVVAPEPRPSTWRTPCFSPTTCSPPRAIAWPWPTPWRAAIPSSTTAWWSWPRVCRPSCGCTASPRSTCSSSIARGQVPASVIDRPKQPYRAPISRCFMGPMHPPMSPNCSRTPMR